MENSSPVKKKVPKIILVLCAGVLIIYMILVLLIIMLEVFPPWRTRQEDFSDFVQQVDRGEVSSITIHNRDETIEAELKDKTTYKTSFPGNFDIKKFVKGKVDRVEVNPQNISMGSIILYQILIFLLFPLVPLLLGLTALLIVRKQQRKAESQRNSS